MQERHKDRLRYFNEQAYTTLKYVIPFIERHLKVTPQMDVLEIGCGEGGNMKPFLDMGCKVTGIDLDASQIDNAKRFYSSHPNNSNLDLLCADIYDTESIDRKFDIIIIRDVVEHIPCQERFLPYIKRFVKDGGIIFVGFPPWQNPFGGHQQACDNKILSHTPWIHLLPIPIYSFLLRKGGVNPEPLIDIKRTGISLERFKKIVSSSDYEIKEEVLYFINPNYEVKFNLSPAILWKFLNIPYIRNFYTTCGYYLLKNK
jgi:SAM-dependent methyltransferase